jgi:hypothetical protein
MTVRRGRPVVLFEGAPKSMHWYEDVRSVLELGRWLEARGELSALPEDWVGFLQSPWLFEQEQSRLRKAQLEGENNGSPA